MDPVVQECLTVMDMEKVLVSSCLLGERVRYDGSAATCHHPVLDGWMSEGRIVPFCPELEAGLPVPRPAVELEAGARARTKAGEDLTEAFLTGVCAAVNRCGTMGIRVAILKEGSPSCGVSRIHDGTFSGQLVPGEGLVVSALRAQGIAVFSETQWDEAAQWLSRREACHTLPGSSSKESTRRNESCPDPPHFR